MAHLTVLVEEMKRKESKCIPEQIIEKIVNEPTLVGKCVYIRYLLSPQSTTFEIICRQDLNIDNPINETSGDGSKNGNNFEIKGSFHAKKSRFNFVQIRPDHTIDYYILVVYNMHEEGIGRAYIFKVPSNDLYHLVVEYGGYAHGTKSELGEITFENMKGRGCEYALRGDPNAKKGKGLALWEELLKYDVPYAAENF